MNKGFSAEACFLAYFLHCTPVHAQEMLKDGTYKFLDNYCLIEEFKKKIILDS